MYSEKYIKNKMMLSLNCLILGQASEKSLTENIGETNRDNNNVEIKFSEFKVSHFKEMLFRRGEVKDIVRNTGEMDLWKVDGKKVDEEENNLEKFTVDDIEDKLGGEKMAPRYPLDDYFKVKEINTRDIHVFIVSTSTVGPSQQGVPLGLNWSDADSIYKWIKQFKMNRGRNKLVGTFGAKFELFQRDDTIRTLWNGMGILYGIEERFKARELGVENNKDYNPIPILAGGPGIGKSRCLDEIEILLKPYVENCSNKNLRDTLENMVVINVTYGNGSAVDTVDLIVGGPASLATRILYEYFRPHHDYGSMSFTAFISHCYKYSGLKALTLATVLEIIYIDTIQMKGMKQTASNPPQLTIVLGIDEFNKLHDVSSVDCKLLINSIGSTMNKSPANIFIIPILAGTVEGPLEQYISGSMHQPLPLPLRLLEDEDSIKIGKSLNLFDQRYVSCHPYFRMSISDIGGHVKTLEYFYMKFSIKLKLCDNDPYKVIIEDVMASVKHTIETKYQLMLNSHWLTEPLAKAILGIPVSKYDKVVINEGKISYQELSSMGIVNLVKNETEKNGTYYQVRLPYLWLSILVAVSSDPGLNYWKCMFVYDDPMYWQNFEDFNAKFWALRLSLFRLLGKKTIKLGELLKGAKFSRDFPEEAEVILPQDIKLCKLRHQYPVTKTNEDKNVNDDMEESWQGYIKLECLKNDDIKNHMNYVYLNAPGAPWDVFGFLKLHTDDENSNQILCVAQQVKLTNISVTQPMIIDQNLFDEEHNKVNDNMNEVPANKWTLLFLTNADAKESLTIKCKSNSALVSREQFQDFYGYIYASRAQFASTNEIIYINSAPTESLRILGISKNLCQAIGSKRPFYSLDELQEKLGINDNKLKKFKKVKF